MAATRIAPLSAGELSAFCAQLAMLLHAGVPAADGVSLLCGDTADKAGRALLEALSATLEQGGCLSAAMQKTGAFPQYAVEMAGIGESSGRLDDVFEALSAYYAREQSTRDSLRSAVTYPLVMLGMMLAVLAVLATQVMPVFAQVFAQLGGGASEFSLRAMRLGGGLGAASLGLVCLLGVGVVWFFVNERSEGGRARIQALFARLGATKKLSRQLALGRFTGAMAMLLQSGLDADGALEMASRLIEDKKLAASVANCREKLAAGDSFADAVLGAGVFSGMSARMVAIGFRTGNVDSVMRSLADSYEDEIDSSIAAMVGVAEPTLVAALSVVVGLILLAVMLPLMGVMSAIG